MNRLMPRQPVPALSVPTVDGPQWVLNSPAPEKFTLVVFYRGLHCPICRTYLAELEKLVDEFNGRGIQVVAISSDGEERAREAKQGWKLARLKVGYGLGLDKALEWGLYLSSSRGKTSVGVVEPDVFSEPGVFAVRPDGTLYWASVQTMPFARPHFNEILAAFDFVIKNDYPARGEVARASA
ncbi:MAG: peroxiredoxin-like family protein [Pseudomonadota bacterium]